MSSNFDETIKMVKYTRQREDRDHEAIKQFLYLAPQIMFLKDYSSEPVSGRYVFVSREWEREFGIKRDQVVGRTDYDVLPRPEAEKKRRDEIYTLDFGRIMTVVATGTRYSGWKTSRMSLIPIKVDGEERFTYLAGMALPPLINQE